MQKSTKVLTVKPWQWVWVDGEAEMHPKPKRRGEMRVAVVAERAVRIELRPKLTCNSPPKANN